MSNTTPLQKIKARLTLENAKQSLAVVDGTYSVYAIEGKESLGSPYVYEISFVSPAKLEVEELVDTDITLLSDINGAGEDHKLIGVHSDVGGGYAENTQEFTS